MSATASRRFPKRWILLGFLLALGVSLGVLARHPWTRQQIDRELAHAIRTELGLDATIGSVQFGLPLRLLAGPIELRHPQHGLLASARRLEVVPSLLGLLQGELDIDRISIIGARVRLRIEDGRIVNLPELAPDLRGQEPPPGAQKLPLDELVVREASLEVDASPSFQASLGDLEVSVQISGGTRFGVQLSAGAGHVIHAQGRDEVRSASFSVQLDPDRVAVDALAFESSLLDLKVTDAVIALPAPANPYHGSLELSLDLAKLARLPHGLSLPDIRGKVALSGKIEGTGERFRARGELHGDHPVLNGFGFGLLDLKLDVTPEEVRLLTGSQGRIANDGGVVLLEGRLGLDPSLPLEVRSEVKHLEFHKLMAQLDVTQECLVNWVLRGGFKLNGTLNPVAVTGPIWAEHVRFKALTRGWEDPAAEEVIGTPPGRVSGRVTIRPDALRFENLQGRLPHSDIAVTVHLGFEPGVGKLGVWAKSSNLDLRDATGLMGMTIAGKGGFDLEVGGTYANTTLTGSLDLADFALDGNRVGHLKTRAVLEKEGLAVRFFGAEVKKGDSHYRIEDLLLDFSQAFSIDARGQLDRLALADFYHTFGLETDLDFAPYQGHVRGPAEVRYTLGFPGDHASGTLTVKTELEVLDASAYGIAFDGGNVEATWHWRDIGMGTRGARLDVTDFRVTKGRGSLSVRGHMDYGGLLTMTVFGQKFALSEVDPLRKAHIDAKGEVDAVGTVRGTLWVPEVALDVSAMGAQLFGRPLGDSGLKFFVSHRDSPWVQRALALDPEAPPPNEPCVRARRALATAEWTTPPAQPNQKALPPRAYLLCGPGFDRRFAFDLALGMHDSLPLRGRAEFQRLPPAWIVPPLPGGEVPLGGVLSGNLTLVGGALSQPDSLVGALEISSLKVGQESSWVTSEGPVRVALTGSGARIERARFAGTGTRVEVAGGASFEHGLAASVTGKLDLQALQSFLPAIARSSGSLSVDVKLTGRPDNPGVFGRATLTQGSLLLAGSDQPIDKVEARLSFSERELLLEELRGSVAGGEVRMHGSAARKGQAVDRFELFITARDIGYSPYAGVDLGFAADTRLFSDSSMRVPQLTGTVRLQRVRYTRPFSLGLTERLTGLSQARRVTRENYDPAKDRLAIDLRVVEETPMRVNNNLLNAELSIEDSERPFRLVGTDQRLGVLGTLALTRGTVTFRNTEFTIEEGTVTFFDEHRVRPKLDLHARSEFKRQADASGARWNIFLHASGEAENLKLETSSDPALAQEDIALLLTVGLTRAEAERLGTTQLTQGAALEALATVTGVDREVKKALPVIDDFAVTSAYSARTNRTEPQVVIGKRLSDRVRATARTGLTSDSNFKTGVEWRLGNQTSVEAGYDNVQTTTASQFGNVGVDLRWRLEFD